MHAVKEYNALLWHKRSPNLHSFGKSTCRVNIVFSHSLLSSLRHALALKTLHLDDLTKLVLDGTLVQRISQSIAHLPLARIVQQTLLVRIHHFGAVGPHTGVGLGRAAFQCLPLCHQLSRVDLLSLPHGIIRHGLIAAHGVDLFL